MKMFPIQCESLKNNSISQRGRIKLYVKLTVASVPSTMMPTRIRNSYLKSVLVIQDAEKLLQGTKERIILTCVPILWTHSFNNKAQRGRGSLKPKIRIFSWHVGHSLVTMKMKTNISSFLF